VKNVSIVLNVVVGLALVVLYFLHFSKGEENKSEVVTPKEVEQSGFTIAYVHSDSIVKNYQYVLDQSKVLEDRAKRIEQDYKNRAEGLQREFNDYQNNMGSLTIGQAKSIEEGLGKKEQNLRMFQERARQELAEMEMNMSRELYNRITTFLDAYSVQNGIQMVVKFDTSSDVLYAGKGLDITNIVIESLNDEYKKEGLNASDSTSVK